MCQKLIRPGIVSAAPLFIFMRSVFVASLFVPGGLVAADRPDPQVHLVEEIVAKVNGEIITRGELEKQRAYIALELQQQKGLTGEALEAAVNAGAAEALRDQIDQLLLVQKAKELNINVDADVNRRIAEIQSESKISDPEKFHEWLQEELKGVSFEDFKQQTKNQFLTQRVISEEVYRNITIPKADVEKYYNEHKKDFVREEVVSLREILVSVGDGSPEKVAAAEKKAKGLVDRVRKGEAKFPDLARQYSDAATATSDGELGVFKRGDLAKDIDDIVFKQNKGYVTDPIRRPAGFEIYRVEEHYAAGQASLDEVQGQINNILSEPIVKPKLREYLTKLRETAFLQIKPGFVDIGAAPGKDTSWQDAAQLKPETTTKEAVAAHAHKKFLHVIPYGHVGGAQDTSPAAPPTVTPVPAAPTTPVTPVAPVTP
ncbi:MAG: peptidylprolyl isomerase [Bryobacteraceae bacterium]|jgi:parvulin-like peptidyl-prolyl isomerase